MLMRSKELLIEKKQQFQFYGVNDQIYLQIDLEGLLFKIHD